MPNYTATLTSKGQFTLPVDIRRLWNVGPGDKLEFYKNHRDQLCIRPINLGPIDCFADMAPRQRLSGLASDDAAIASAVAERNLLKIPRQAAE